MDPTLDGNWTIAGIPDPYVVTFLMFSQVGDAVYGDLMLEGQTALGVVPESLSVTGSNTYPTVRLFFSGGPLTFELNGTFTNDTTIEGTLTGGLTGSVTMTAAS